jgi:serine-type D-Ala-D-Ala endopeptidase (penicillin-binding protein 7)
MKLLRHSMMLRASVAAVFLAVASVATAVSAASVDSGAAGEPDKTALAEIYRVRTDLQRVFSADWSGNAAMRAAGMASLEDWARRYGHKEYPNGLASYAPSTLPPALRPIANAVVPKVKVGAAFDYSTVTASSVFVVDLASRAPLMAHAADKPHPMASISKLMTAMVGLDSGLSLAKRVSVVPADEVGGARLSVAKGDSLTALQLLNTTLIASANNTANAFARATGLAKVDFVAAMNAKAAALGLTHTKFADPTGIEVDNVSTAQEIAALGIEAFALDDIRRATTTSRYPLTLAGGPHNLKNTNEILNDPNNGLYVLGGKTGYLEESKWNLVVKLRDARMKTLIVVVLGSDSKAQSFADAEKVARWAWDNHSWSR